MKKRDFNETFNEQINEVKDIINKGRYDLAIHHYKKLLPLCWFAADGIKSYSIICNNIGSAFIFQGLYDSATIYLTLAASAASNDKKKYSVDLLRSYNNLSVIFNHIKENQKSLKYLELAENIAKENSYRDILLGIYVNKGKIYDEMHLLPESETEFNKALALSNTMNPNEDLSQIGISLITIKQTIYTNLGKLYLSKKEPVKAIELLKKAESYFSKTSNPYFIIPNYIITGDAYFALGKNNEAEQYLQTGLDLSLKAGIKDYILQAYHDLSLVYASTNRYEKAFKYHRLHHGLEDSIKGIQKENDISQMESKYKMAEKDREIAQSKLLASENSRLLKNRNLVIVLISAITLLVSLVLVGVYLSYRQKQRLQQQNLAGMEKDKQIAIMKAMLEGEENERSRIAQNLHDGVGSIVSAIKMNYSVLKQSDSENKEIYKNGMMLLDEAATELRNTAHNLTPEIILQDGLETAIHTFCKKMSNKQMLQITSQLSGNFDSIGKDMELFVYRIVQELVNNIVKHADASNAVVQINYSDGLLVITVEDDGIGMGNKQNDGIGLKSMKRKINMMNGSVNIESSPSDGTQVYIEIDC